MKRRARLVVNRLHLREYPPSILQRVEQLLREAAIEPEIVYTRAEASIASQVAAEATAYDLFLVWGGDGTVAEVATGLIGTGTPLGVLPAGTFNNIARALGLPKDPLAAARLLVMAQPRAMDVGFANGQVFLEVAGVGLDAAVMPFGERLKARDFRALLPALVRLARFRAVEMTLDLDHARGIQVRTPLVVVANGPFYGAGFTIAPDARWDDGRLTVRVFEGAGVLELVWYFLNIARHRRPSSTRGLTFRARCVRVSAAIPLAVHADGRLVGTTPVYFEAQPGALYVLVPSAGAAEAKSRAARRWPVALGRR
jgi:diacylglycerol kinase (ATP)